MSNSISVKIAYPKLLDFITHKELSNKIRTAIEKFTEDAIKQNNSELIIDLVKENDNSYILKIGNIEYEMDFSKIKRMGYECNAYKIGHSSEKNILFLKFSILPPKYHHSSEKINKEQLHQYKAAADQIEIKKSINLPSDEIPAEFKAKILNILVKLMERYKCSTHLSVHIDEIILDNASNPIQMIITINKVSEDIDILKMHLEHFGRNFSTAPKQKGYKVILDNENEKKRKLE